MSPDKEVEAADDDWEWEYDETETEDYYIPIVLPTALSTTKSNFTGRKSRSKQQSIKKDENRLQQQQQQQQKEAEKGKGKAKETANPSSPTNPTSTDQKQTPNNVDITNLNTFNPQITYKGYTYTCDWANTIGTDMFFTKPNISETTQTNPAPRKAQQSDKDANTALLGTSRVKLVARQPRKVVAPLPSQSLPRSHYQSETATQPTPSDKNTTTSITNAANDIQPSRPSLAPQLLSTSPASASASASASAAPLPSALKRRNQQESFLQRLIDIKRQRGDADADAVPMYGVGRDPLPGFSTAAAAAAAAPTAATRNDVTRGDLVGEGGEGANGGNDDGNVGDRAGETGDNVFDNMDVTDGP